MKVHIDPDDIQELNADDRGRVYLGTEYANEHGLQIAVLNAQE